MKLELFKYSQFDQQPNEWKLDGFTLNNTNLLVGNNASGKTRILNTIRGLAFILSRAKTIQYRSGNYEAHFKQDRKNITYFLKYEEGRVGSGRRSKRETGGGGKL